MRSERACLYREKKFPNITLHAKVIYIKNKVNIKVQY
jgi:hypothetical protein